MCRARSPCIATHLEVFEVHPTVHARGASLARAWRQAARTTGHGVRAEHRGVLRDTRVLAGRGEPPLPLNESQIAAHGREAPRLRRSLAMMPQSRVRAVLCRCHQVDAALDEANQAKVAALVREVMPVLCMECANHREAPFTADDCHLAGFEPWAPAPDNLDLAPCRVPDLGGRTFRCFGVLMIERQIHTHTCTTRTHRAHRLRDSTCGIHIHRQAHTHTSTITNTRTRTHARAHTRQTWAITFDDAAPLGSSEALREFSRSPSATSRGRGQGHRRAGRRAGAASAARARAARLPASPRRS